VAFISLGVILLSTIAMTLNTLPSLRRPRSQDNGTDAANQTTGEMVEDESDGDNEYLAMIEAVCVCWMAMEYVARMWASPDRYTISSSISRFVIVIILFAQ